MCEPDLHFFGWRHSCVQNTISPFWQVRQGLDCQTLCVLPFLSQFFPGLSPEPIRRD